MSELHLFRPGRWRELEQLEFKMGSARRRCREIAASESLTGFEDSATMYLILSDEVLEAYGWVSRVLP